jgi:hypothetical protein
VAPIKSKDQFFESDPTHEWFPFLSLEKQYEIVSKYCSLHDGVAEDVRSYFNAVVTLYLYGWLYYPFYTMAAFLSSFVVEMALRERFPPKKLNKRGRDLRTLRHLLREAKDAGVLREEGFPSLENLRANIEALNQQFPEILGQELGPQPEKPYVDDLIEWLPETRNRFAHPNMHAIMMPGQALDPLIVAAEIINQLWPKPSRSSVENETVPGSAR